MEAPGLGKHSEQPVASATSVLSEEGPEVFETVDTYVEAIEACRATGQWQQALSLLKAMQTRGMRANEACYKSTIMACGDAGEWQTAVAVFKEMALMGVPTGVASYNAAIAACGRSGQVEIALALFRKLQLLQKRQKNVRKELQIAADCVSYNTAIAACEKGGHCKQAMALMKEMEQARSVTPNEQTYSAVITACGNGRRWKQVGKISSYKWLAICELRH